MKRLAGWFFIYMFSLSLAIDFFFFLDNYLNFQMIFAGAYIEFSWIEALHM